MYRIVVVTQARLGSSRLPGKVLMPVCELNMLETHLLNAGRCKTATDLIVASTWETDSQNIKQVADDCGWHFFQGSTNDVLDRYYTAVKSLEPDIVVRITSDCPLVQPDLIDLVVKKLLHTSSEYVSTSLEFPDGIDVEAFTFASLQRAWTKAYLSSDREHVTPFIRRMADHHVLLEPDTTLYKDVRLTVDELEDIFCIRHLVSLFGWERNWKVYSDYVLKHPTEFQNQGIIRNEGYIRSLENEREDD